MEREKEIVTRIYITEEGDIVVTDLWEEIYAMICEDGGTFFEIG